MYKNDGFNKIYIGLPRKYKVSWVCLVWFGLLDFCFLLKKGIDSDIPEVESL